METLEISNTKMLLVRCFGLSLSDQYWIKPEGADMTWDQINYFDNAFSDDIGDVLFGANKKANALDLSSPDNTSDGNLKKRWRIINEKRCLVKGGSNPFRQQPFNEVIATGVMKRLGIKHIPYMLEWNKGAPYSICEDFVTRDTELVPAWRIIQTQKKPNSISVYQHFVNCCEALGIPDAVPFLDRMIVLDYIIANEDRHLNNFGALRNAETLEWLGMAPIYDSGSSLGYDKLAGQIRSGREVVCKPFKKHHLEQLKLVSSFAWIDFARLSDVRELITDTLSSKNAKDYIDESRISVIADTTERRIQHVAELAMTQSPAQTQSTSDDVCLTQRQARRERDSGRILLFLLLFLPLAGMTLYYWASNGSLSAAFALPLATTLLVGIGEELMFRRFLFDGLLRRGQSFIAALLLSAFLFSLLHSVNVLAGLPFRQMLVQLGTTFLAGLFYALLYDYTKNIFLMIALHWLWDYLLLSGAVQAIPAFGIILPALNVVEILLIPVLLFLRRQAEKARQGGGV